MSDSENTNHNTGIISVDGGVWADSEGGWKFYSSAELAASMSRKLKPIEGEGQRKAVQAVIDALKAVKYD